jgi:hypothetical protein
LFGSVRMPTVGGITGKKTMRFEEVQLLIYICPRKIS